MYGSSFCMVTLSPRAFRSRPSEDAVKPFPSEEATPPVTKMCFVTGCHPIARPPSDRWMVRGSSAAARAREQFGRMLAGGCAVRRARQHPRQFLDPLAVGEGTHGGGRRRAV